MRRSILAVAYLVLVANATFSQAQTKAKPQSPAPATATPDLFPPRPEGYIASPGTGRSLRPGDQAEIVQADAPGCVSASSLKDYLKLWRANDRIGMADHAKAKTGFALERGTRVLVIESHVPVQTVRVGSLEELDRQILGAGIRADEPKPLASIEVRVIDGQRKGMRLFVEAEALALLVPAGPDPRDEASEKTRKAESAAVRAAKEAKKAQLATPESRSSSLLNVARNLERSGKTKAALENYRKVAKEFPGTPAAKDAASRIKTLEGK